MDEILGSRRSSISVAEESTFDFEGLGRKSVSALVKLKKGSSFKKFDTELEKRLISADKEMGVSFFVFISAEWPRYKPHWFSMDINVGSKIQKTLK